MQKPLQVLLVIAKKDGKEKKLFFGAVSSIYDYWSADELGIGYKSLLNYFKKAEADETNEDGVITYTNRSRTCTIIKGVLITKAKSTSPKTQA